MEESYHIYHFGKESRDYLLSLALFADFGTGYKLGSLLWIPNLQ